MTSAEFARHRGCTPAAVCKAIKTNRISTLPGKRINPSQADAEWERNTEPRFFMPKPKEPKQKAGSLSASGKRPKARRTQDRKDETPDLALQRALCEVYNSHFPNAGIIEFIGVLETIFDCIRPAAIRELKRQQVTAGRTTDADVDIELSSFEKDLLDKLNAFPRPMNKLEVCETLRILIYRLIPAAFDEAGR